VLEKDQILLKGREFYLCAPRGQLVEGYLVIAPFACIGCLAEKRSDALNEVVRMRDLVLRFYRECYGVQHAIVYEQGRAGGGAVLDAAGRFPLHAHLCFLPVAVDVHEAASREYTSIPVTELDALPELVSGKPYLYVEAWRGATGVKAAYVAATPGGRSRLETLRLKPEIARLLGHSDRGAWRDYPGDEERARVIRNFAGFASRLP